jgi:glutaredoxin
MNEYRNELEQIRKETLFKDLMKKITGGEFVALADYVNDLSFEQREVLRAQMEAVKNRREEEARERKEKETVPQIISKRARGMVGAFVRNKQLKIERKQSG